MIIYNSFEKTTGGKPVDESNLICHPLEIKGNPDRKVVGGCHIIRSGIFFDILLT